MRELSPQELRSKWRQYAAAFAAETRFHGIEQVHVDAALSYAKPLVLQGLPPIYDLEHFAALTGIPTTYISMILNSNERGKNYRTFEIPKKNGGHRVIAEPLPTLKYVQRWILDYILAKIPPHPAAHAFYAGKSIKSNARFHRAQDFHLILDIDNFFPSINAGRVFSLFHSLGYSPFVCNILTELCVLDRALPQGAPTSPALSNLVFRNIDARLLGFAQANNFRYTRYADDLTFSGGKHPGFVRHFVQKVLSVNGFKLNETKTRILCPGQRKLITGVIANNYVLRAQREIRREVRTAAYFIEKFGLEGHLAHEDEQRANYLEHYIGLCNFILHLDPSDKNAQKALNVFLQYRWSQSYSAPKA